MPTPQIVRAEIEIDATPEVVFDLLTDLAKYPEWNPFTEAVETELEIGEPVTLYVKMPGRPRVVQREWVNRVEAPERICWGIRWALRDAGTGALTTNRHQLLESLGEARTRYTTWDEFSGWLVPLVFAIYGGPMRKAFAQMAEALRVRCESLYAADPGAGG